ncbi:hypothetical protein NM208_g5190 [Fusarium decemcellulare]|uniref:Uncharacterized protein n=1 Tax=Fusarium decemcellulare TaxID=57161 RepID=A0ACC1SI78_9HYPO|nr:hypothetical protein NM208_g5190 [Fusarium decemcellulare]
MVHISFATLGLMALASITATAASAIKSSSNDTVAFSWETWANGIIANPCGTHATPEEAVELSRDTTSSAEDVYCNTILATDAAKCIDSLARRPAENVWLLPHETRTHCLDSQVSILVFNCKTDLSTKYFYGKLARAAARIMDRCAKGDRVQGEGPYSRDQRHLHVRIRRIQKAASSLQEYQTQAPTARRSYQWSYDRLEFN